MKNRIFLAIITALLIAGCKNNSVSISGSLLNPVGGSYIFLDELKSDNLLTVDSITVAEDGTFNFKREIDQPSFYLLKIRENNFLTMLVEPGQKISLNAFYDSLNYPVTVTGSKGTELMAEYNKTLRRTINKLTALNSIYMENVGNPDLPKVIERLDSMAQGYLSEINIYTKKYIDENLTSLVSLVALYQQVAPSVYVLNPAKDMKYFVKVDSSLTISYPEYEPVKSLHSQVQEIVATMKGETGETPAAGELKEAPEIALPTPQGDTIRLSSTRGKVVLLDFWASWCAPCRLENPNLVKAYTTYSRKGFQIFQVSLDKTKDAWLKGIKDDKLEKWIHVSDVQYWNSVVVPLYKIESIPSNFLLDKDGKIIATNLRGDQLQKKLAEIFDN
jgi:thiol-disulfide isomerase/thioredoxin